MKAVPKKNIKLCLSCVLPETFPGIRFNPAGICNYCLDSEVKKEKANKEKEQFRQKFAGLINNLPSLPYQALVAYSGGKDSSYLLRILRKNYGLRVLAVTFDNGFVSPAALQNIETITQNLEIDHYKVTPNLKMLIRAFRDSLVPDLYPLKALVRASSVCNTCMHLVKSYLLKTAIEMGIPLIAYGWSPGQAPIQSSIMKWNAPWIRQTQKLFTRTLYGLIGEDIRPFALEERHYRILSEDSAFDRGLYNVHPLSFLEYDEEKIIRDIEALGWENPKDTDPNSTNCLLNALGIQFHLEHFGFHPYAFEIAGLVWEGCLNREEGLRKLAEPPNPEMVRQVKEKLGVEEPGAEGKERRARSKEHGAKSVRAKG